MSAYALSIKGFSFQLIGDFEKNGVLLALPTSCPEYNNGTPSRNIVIADADTPQASALVTSANFSEAAQRHNFEAGWLVREPWRADMVNSHFQQLVGAGLFVELHGRAEPANNQG
jgi:hypothetical protein